MSETKGAGSLQLPKVIKLMHCIAAFPAQRLIAAHPFPLPRKPATLWETPAPLRLSLVCCSSPVRACKRGQCGEIWTGESGDIDRLAVSKRGAEIWGPTWSIYVLSKRQRFMTPIKRTSTSAVILSSACWWSGTRGLDPYICAWSATPS